MKTSSNCGTNCACKKPIAKVAINKSRIKIYDKNNDPKYYLEDGQEFQIELFNPTETNVLAKIKLNGNFISNSGLVLKPGQRYFLDRYLDEAKKFKFDTYEVSTSQEVKEAIKNNGNLEVLFYNEKFPIISNLTFIGNNSSNFPTYSPPWSTSIGYNGGEINDNFFLCSYNSSIESNNIGELTRSSKTIETGRVEKGSDSEQEFQDSYLDFESYTTNIVKYKILPKSNLPKTIEQIKKYCTNCGNVLGRKHKFCSQCGTKS